MERQDFCQGDSSDKKAETKDKGNQESSKVLYSQLESDRRATLDSAKRTLADQDSIPGGFGVIPPYLLEHLARANGDRGAFADTFKKTIEMQNKGSLVNAGSSEDFQGMRQVYDAKGKETLPGDKARFEGESPAGNEDVDRAYDFTGVVRNFYLKEYNRNSIDGAGMKFISSVNYGQNYENAFFDGAQMAYGRPGPNSPFKTFLLLDLAAHEITHGVTQKEAGLKYFGQMGALNESLSDVFGELIKQYSKNQTADQADWLVGEGIFREGVHGRALRDMLHPGTAYDDPKLGKDPQPDNMNQRVSHGYRQGQEHVKCNRTAPQRGRTAAGGEGGASAADRSRYAEAPP